MHKNDYVHSQKKKEKMQKLMSAHNHFFALMSTKTSGIRQIFVWYCLTLEVFVRFSWYALPPEIFVRYSTVPPPPMRGRPVPKASVQEEKDLNFPPEGA